MTLIERLRADTTEPTGTEDVVLVIPPSGVMLEAAERIAELETALRIIAGREQCIDNLMSNVEVACAALDMKA